MQSIYSFLDIDFIITHPSKGQYSANGQGLGDVAVSMSNDVSAHALAADGSVMTSRIAAANGTVTLNVQQTSSLHAWLEQLYNYLITADNTQWAAATIVMRNRISKETTTCTGVCFQKRPDTQYQQQGQYRSWAFLTADIQKVV